MPSNTTGPKQQGYIFNSGIRIIRVYAADLAEAKRKLEVFEPDAWTNPTWNWRITVVPSYPRREHP
jgi:hypothetical protein